MITEQVPQQRLNGYPIVAAVPVLHPAGGQPTGRVWSVVCARTEPSRAGTYVTWLVHHRDQPPYPAHYLCETGHYDLPLADALADMLARANIPAAREEAPQ